MARIQWLVYMTEVLPKELIFIIKSHSCPMAVYYAIYQCPVDFYWDTERVLSTKDYIFYEFFSGWPLDSPDLQAGRT